MAINEKEARELVVKAGLELIKKELIARTWGNISARISDTEFVITPSGKPYETLKPSDLVKVKIDDLSYEGDVKPSSEKGIHAFGYKLRKDVNFIIHTHQNYATAISIEQKGQTFAPIAKYGLSSTKGLAKNVYQVIKDNPKKDCFLMTRHGAIVLGKDYEDAFKKAEELEVLSKEHFEKNIPSVFKGIKGYLDDYVQVKGLAKEIKGEDPLTIELLEKKNLLASKYAYKAKPLPFYDVLLQHTVYKLKYSKLKNKK